MSSSSTGTTAGVSGGENSVTTPTTTKDPPNRFSATNKSARSGRKISLPWFRQNSLTSSSALARQHTIDSPGSYRYFKQSSENNAKVHTFFLCHERMRKVLVFSFEWIEQFTKVILVVIDLLFFFALVEYGMMI